MPIIALEQQQQLREIGRIRMGDQRPTQSGRTRPNRLDRFRLTSQDRGALEVAAQRYGGLVREWADHPGEYELYIEQRELPCVVSPRPVEQWYELWSAGGCQRRCDGEHELISGGPCRCNPASRECRTTTRFWVFLHQLPGLGVWRLETHGYYSAVELPLYAKFLNDLAQNGKRVEVRLAIQTRSVKRQGQTRTFPTPVLLTDVSLAELLREAGHLLGQGEERQALPPAPVAAIGVDDGPEVVADVPEVLADFGAPEPQAGLASEPALEAPRRASERWEGPGQCPDCHAPAGSRHATRCKSRG